MSANERIEQLLNHFGQTIEDLPKPTFKGGGYSIYDRNAVWDMTNKQGWILEDYILHMAAIIDRMQVALNNVVVRKIENDDQ